MDQSFLSAMNDAVVADAARLSGRRFADARGTGIARRVRTRRTVRAAGVGGVSAVAVGAIALGAAQAPWSEPASPVGSWPAGCTPTPVADVGAIWDDAAEPRAHVIDVSAEHDVETWYLYDDTLEMVVLQMVPTEFGLDVTFADGTRQLVQMWSTWPTVFEAPGGGWVILNPIDSEPNALWTADAPAEAAIVQVQDDVTPPFEWQWTGCEFGTPSASASADPSSSQDPAIKPEDVVGDSPFECGFEFPAESFSAESLSIDDAEWLMPDEVDRQHPKSGDKFPTWDYVSRDELVASVTVDYAMPGSGEGDTARGVIGTGDPSLEKLPDTHASASADYYYAKGRTFVGVRNGKVVATGSRAGDDPADLAAVFIGTSGWLGGDVEQMYLIDPANALTSCDTDPVDLEHVDIVAVAGLIVQQADGTVDPTIYAWLPVDKP